MIGHRGRVTTFLGVKPGSYPHYERCQRMKSTLWTKLGELAMPNAPNVVMNRDKKL